MTKPSSTTPPRSYVFFTDRDLGSVIIPKRLEALGVQVETHDKHFKDPKTPDVVWMRFVASQGWVVLSRNYKQRYESIERDMIMRSGLAVFYLIGKLIGKTAHQQLTDNLVRTFPKVLAFRNEHEPPFIAHITRPGAREPVGAAGTVRLVLNYEQWRAQYAPNG